MKKATLMTILLLFAFFACACRGDVADETTLYWGDDPIVSYGDGGFSVFGGDVGKRLTLENDRFDKLGITVYLQNGSSSSVSAKKGSTATMKRKAESLRPFPYAQTETSRLTLSQKKASMLCLHPTAQASL